jgi:diguanylate cyclase (GGDEF)-like protein/PAS domain S-box-containing protein
MNSDIDFIDLYRRAKAQVARQLDSEDAGHHETELQREIKIYQAALKLQRDELLAREVDLRLQNRLIETSQTITHVGSLEVDVATRKMRWSTETYRIHDTTPEEFEPTLDEDLKYYPQESRSIIAAAFKLALEEGKAFDLELEKFTLKGRKIAVRTTCTPSQENGQITKLVGIYQDITERKLKEKLIHEKEVLLSESQRIAHIGSWSWDLVSNLVVWSEETYAIYGVRPEHFVPTRSGFFSLIHPEDRPLIVKWWNQCSTGKAATELEFRIVRPDGHVRFITGRGNQERDANGTPLRVVGTVQDITERKQTELYQKHQSQVLGMIADKTSLEFLLGSMARDIEYIYPGIRCTILLLDEYGQHLHHCAAPSMPDFFNKAIDGETIGLGRGSCGTAAFTGERVIVENISTHPWWSAYKELALQAGLESCWSQPILSSSGKVLGTFAIYHNHPSVPTPSDIQLIETEAKLAALAIDKHKDRTRLEMAANVFVHAREGIIITDAQAKIIDVNDTFCSITGYNRTEVIGKNPRILQSGYHSQDFFQQLWSDLRQKGFWSGEIWNKRKNGEVFADMQTISAVTDSDGKPINYVSLFTDITTLKEYQHQLEYIAHYDALTRLPNRVLLGDRLKQAVARSHRLQSSLGVLYIDLDGFKNINDNYGHDIGDQLLVTVAARWSETLREGDTLARIGGDEFIVILTDIEHAEDYELILKRLLSSASEPVTINQTSLRVSASIGVTIYPQDGADADQLMRHADQAMYLAKQAGKNCFHLFDVAKDVAVKTQRESLDHIRQGLDNSEFVLYYQPKVNMRTGKIIGLEALIRWQHPERGLLPPSAFLPIIEDHLLGIDLGDWVINQALTQMSEWRNHGLDVCVSINVSAIQLQSPHFVKRLREQLNNHADIPPGNLELEILETSALADISDIANLMRQCHQLGVRFAVDDFGTGYSSLTYLKHLPAALLKIDQSFVRDMLDDPDDLAIVKGVIGLANAFHRQVIAEGVETIAHGQLLLQQNCELAQGYGIARPMPASAIQAWILNWQPDQSWTSNPAPNQTDS